MTKKKDMDKTIDSSEISDRWKPVAGGDAVHQRFEFQSYAQTSRFLEALAELSEETGVYPDLSFAKSYANVTIPSDGGEKAKATQQDFAARAEAIFGDVGK